MCCYLKPVVSYTTREKRENETEGVEHYFITPEVAKEKLKTEHILAYTKTGDIEYFATVEALHDSNLYIINPDGIRYLKEHYNDLNLKVIYIKTDEKLRIERAKKRDNKDFEKSFEKRNAAEDEDFTQFENEGKWDLLLENNKDGKDCIKKFFNYILDQRQKSVFHNLKDPLYLVVGRTGSGKDYITTSVINIFNRRLLEL